MKPEAITKPAGHHFKQSGAQSQLIASYYLNKGQKERPVSLNLYRQDRRAKYSSVEIHLLQPGSALMDGIMRQKHISSPPKPGNVELCLECQSKHIYKNWKLPLQILNWLVFSPLYWCCPFRQVIGMWQGGGACKEPNLAKDIARTKQGAKPGQGHSKDIARKS